MGRVFWQFFLAIWLTIAGAIGFTVVTNSYLKVLPPKGGMREGRQRVAFETLTELVRRNELDIAERYIVALASLREPTHVSLKPVADTAAEASCRSDLPPEFEFTLVSNGTQCFRIHIEDKPLGFVDTYLPDLLPPVSVLLTSFISALLLARYLIRDVMVLRTGLSALAGGDFSVRIGAASRRRDQIAALSHDFDTTAGKLEALQESQKRLFHDVSHELRSPLSRMQAAFGLLKQNPAKTDAVLLRLEREIVRLDQLVEEILTLARLGSPKGQGIERQSLDVIDLLKTSYAMR